MRTEVIRADTIDEAADEILKVLKEDGSAGRSISSSSRDHVIYFDGWDGLGASAVLRAVAQRVSPPAGRQGAPAAGLEFEQVVHIDCSVWESRRALQRAVAEQLKLPDQVMELLDRQDEEDDFKGVPQGSRAEVQPVVEEMYRHIQNLNRRFLVIFHNGSGEEVDLASLCGFPLVGWFSTNKVLWTFQGRFRLQPRAKVDMAIKSAGTTNAFLSAARKARELWPYLVNQEALDMVGACTTNNTGTRSHRRSVVDLLQPAQVVECILYIMELHSHSIDYDLATHSANYCVCEGILQQLQQEERSNDDGADDGFWRAVDALQGEMRLDADNHQFSTLTHLARLFVESRPYWSSPTHGFTRVPAGVIPNGDMFRHYSDKLAVLKISRCTFAFQSPPFCHCHSVRFLWLDHCQDTRISTGGIEDKEAVHRFFQRLWVLVMRYTNCDQILSAQTLDLMTQLRELIVMGARDWDMGQLHGRLPNIRKLRITNSGIIGQRVLTEMNKMELLDFSGNYSNSPMKILSRPGAISNSSCLETVIVDGSERLEHISFRGCSKLKSLFLRGEMWNLRTLDISGTTVKILDLTATTIQYLNELYLLGCENLCAITWPPKDNIMETVSLSITGPPKDDMKPVSLSKLRIETTQSAPIVQSTREENAKRDSTTTGTSEAAAVLLHGSRPISEFPWYISVRDARLLTSLEPVYSDSRKIYVEVSSPASPTIISGGGCKDEGIESSCSSDQQVLASLQQQQQQTAPAIYTAESTVNHLKKEASEGDGDALGIMWMWSCPGVPDLPQESCYMHIQDQARKESFSQGGEGSSSTSASVPKFVSLCAKILHIHDSTSVTHAPSATTRLDLEWQNLEWCRVERCPRVESVFTASPSPELLGIFEYSLRTFWASHLPKARCIWELRENYVYDRTFPNLTFLHLDCCPRLRHVLPLSLAIMDPWGRSSLSQLKTLEITWCGDLREVFPLDFSAKNYAEREPQPVVLDFPSLKHIHLHELPSLRRICGVRMSTPNLETLKIRGCWSLRRLPDVSGSGKVVECDCEKEWWDKLEWDDGSQASRYKPIHSRYYKKTFLRTTVLR